MSDPIISSPPTMFGGYIQNASLNIGYGADSGSCQLTLVYEKDGPLRDNFDPEIQFPALGTAIGFKFGECTFGGIFQRYTNKRSMGGYTWDIIVESPGKWLEGIQIILDSFQGNRFTVNGVLNETVKDGVFTNQLNNIWNPYACREYYGYRASDNQYGIYGGSNINSAGFPAIDALNLIQRISQGKEAFGGKAVFGDSSYEVDLSEVIALLSKDYKYFRVKGPIQSLSSIIQECCEIALHDFVVFIEPKNGEITENGVITDPIIKVRVIDKSFPPDPNTIKQIVNSYEKSNKLMSADFGKEFNDAVTQRLVIGGPASRYNFINIGSCYPVWGKISMMGNLPTSGNVVYDQARISSVNTGYTFGTGMGLFDNAPIVLKNTNTIYLATILEIRCAMASFDTWMLYKLLMNSNFPGYSNIRLDRAALQKLQNGTATVNEILDSSIKKQQFFKGIYSAQNIMETLEQLHGEVKQAGEEFYGKKFLVPLPVEGTALANNIKWLSEDQSYVTSWQVSDSAWTEFKPFLDVSFYDAEGKLRSTASWQINSQFDYSGLSGSYAYDQLTGGIGTSQVDYLCKDIMFFTGTPFGLGAYVVVDVPAVSYFDAYSTQNYGFFHLLKLIKNINAHPNIMQSFGNENGPLSHQIAPARVPPMMIGVPQESNRYSWGPWWNWSSKKGKAEVVMEADLKPETFGGAYTLDQVAFSYAYVPNANVAGNESGYVELAEIPAYNLARRFAGTGPYITNIDINIGMDGVKTTYKFNTWTPQFGKLAKYNADRISRINKNYIRFLQEQRKQFDNPPLPALQAPKSIFSSPNMGSRMFGMRSMNMVMGQMINGPDGKVRPNVQANNLDNAVAAMPDDTKTAAGCSQEQIQTPIRVDKQPSSTNSGNMSGFESPKAITQQGKFEGKHAGPTNKELNPYYAQPKHDFQLAVSDNSDNYNLQERQPDSVRTMGFRGPLLLSGWGYGLDDSPVPAKGATGNDRFVFHPDAGNNRSLWKTGPVHLMWDEERKVWAGGPHIIEGILLTNISKPVDPTKKTTFDIKLYRTSNWDYNNEIITCTNRDPSLEVMMEPKDKNKILIIAIRINYEWRPLWVGCPDSI